MTRKLLYDMDIRGDGATVAESAASHVEGVLEGPLEVHVHVTRRRLKSHESAQPGVLRGTAPTYPLDRGAIEQGFATYEALENAAWREGAVSVLLVTCSWATEVMTRIRIYRQPIATVEAAVAAGLDQAPTPTLEPRRWVPGG